MSIAGKRSQKEKDKAQSRQPTVEQESLPPEQQNEQNEQNEQDQQNQQNEQNQQNQQEITTVRSAVGPSLVPGFSNEQVHAFEAYLGGMIDARLERFFGRFSEQRQWENPIPSVEFSPPPRLPQQQQRKQQDLPPAPYTSAPYKPKPADIGFFDTEYIEEKGSTQTTYTDVFAFVERLKDLAARYGKDTIRDLIYPCLKGRCLQWFTDLTELEKELLYMANFDRWCTAMLRDLKLRIAEAMV